MAWFKVDDKFHTSEPVKRIPRAERMGAIGLWTLAGSWSADHLKDGYIPAFMVDELGGTTKQADALVRVGLWKRVRDGYRFTEWEEWQPTRAQVEANRKAERDRKARYRAGKAENAGGVPADVPPGQKRRSGAPRPDPTRPDPTRPDDDSMNPPDVVTSQRSRARIAQGEKAVDNFDLDAVTAELFAISPDYDPEDADSLRERALAAGRHILGKAPKDVSDPTAYIVKSIHRDEAGWSRFAYEGSIP